MMCDYSEELYIMDTEEQITVNICGFELVCRAEVEMIGRKLQNQNQQAAGGDEVIGEITKE